MIVLYINKKTMSSKKLLKRHLDFYFGSFLFFLM
jgi:hypothetical protein